MSEDFRILITLRAEGGGEKRAHLFNFQDARKVDGLVHVVAQLLASVLYKFWRGIVPHITFSREGRHILVYVLKLKCGGSFSSLSMVVWYGELPPFYARTEIGDTASSV